METGTWGGNAKKDTKRYSNGWDKWEGCDSGWGQMKEEENAWPFDYTAVTRTWHYNSMCHSDPTYVRSPLDSYHFCLLSCISVSSQRLLIHHPVMQLGKPPCAHAQACYLHVHMTESLCSCWQRRQPAVHLRVVRISVTKCLCISCEMGEKCALKSSKLLKSSGVMRKWLKVQVFMTAQRLRVISPSVHIHSCVCKPRKQVKSWLSWLMSWL